MSIIYPNVVSAAGVKKKQKYIAVSLMYDASLEFDAGLNLFFLVSLFPSCLLFVVLWPHLPKIFSPNTNTLNLYALENKILLYSLFPSGAVAVFMVGCRGQQETCCQFISNWQIRLSFLSDNI